MAIYTSIREFYRYGNESDYVDCTFKEWNSLEKAIAYAHRYTKGVRFAGVRIEDESGNPIYEITSDQKVFDYRNNISK